MLSLLIVLIRVFIIERARQSGGFDALMPMLKLLW